MVTDRSERTALPAALAVALVPVSWAAMQFVAGKLLPRVGLRPALMLAEGALALPALALTAWMCARPQQALGLRPTAPRSLVLAVLAGVTLWIASLGLMELQSSFWAPPAGYIEQFRRLHELLRPNGILDGLLSLAAIALAPAICEELLFRGTVLPALLRRLGPWPAVLGSAVLFGLIHVDGIQRASGPELTLYRVPFALAVGIGLGLLRLRTGSLLATILAHCTLNSITLGLAPWVDDPTDSARSGDPALGLALLLGGSLASAALLRVRYNPTQSKA